MTSKTDLPSQDAGQSLLESVAARLDLLLERTAINDRRFLPVDAAADYVGLSVESIRRLLSAGKLTALRPVRGRVVVDKRELDAFVSSSTIRPRTGRGRR